MLDKMRKRPLRLKAYARKLAALHLAVSHNAVPGLNDGRSRARHLTENSLVLSSEAKSFVLSLLDGLPDGGTLCHGDFHPGNILVHEGRHYVIDWFGAYRGDMLSDAAHTYLLMKNVPRYPGLSPAVHRVMKLSGGIFADAYLEALRSLTPFDMAQFSKWLAVKAAERSFYGMPAEKPGLARFIETCRQHSGDPASWYKRI